MKLNKNKMLSIAKVASLYGTGGGISYRNQEEFISQFVNEIVEIKNVDDFNLSDYLVEISGIGPSADDLNIKEMVSQIKRMIEVLEKLLNIKIAGIYAPELGQENVLFGSAVVLGLPIANFEPAGMRAKPCLDITSFEFPTNKKRTLSPLVISTAEGEILTLNDICSPKRIETILRTSTKLSKTGVIFCVYGTVNVEYILKNKLNNETFTHLEQIIGLNFNDWLKFEKAKQVFEAKAIKINDVEKNGFLLKNVEFISNNEKHNLVLQNEAMFILNDKKEVVYSVPDRICLIDKEKMEGIWIGNLKEGFEFSIVILEPDKIWKNNIIKAKQIFGYERFKNLL